MMQFHKPCEAFKVLTDIFYTAYLTESVLSFLFHICKGQRLENLRICTQTNSVREPMNCGVALTPILRVSSSTILPMENHRAAFKRYRLGYKSPRMGGKQSRLPPPKLDHHRLPCDVGFSV